MRPAGEGATAVPEPVVKRARRNAGRHGEKLAGVNGAGAQLDLLS